MGDKRKKTQESYCSGLRAASVFTVTFAMPGLKPAADKKAARKKAARQACGFR
jgi:hypothetical protein